ncbi:MAG: hypothetical protein EPN21_03885 [Methylococcaceae bacterium]|nr:MAG: hypothetical protein EPN21_03885 [Methylococcaceae bacterium]
MKTMCPAGVAWSLALLLWSGSAAAQITDSYRLPPSKQNLEACRIAALALTPGTVERFELVWQQNVYWFRFDIRGRHEGEQRVYCDGATGHIVRVEPMAATLTLSRWSA